MITKKIGLTYTFLFLFAFTFALSFTLASQAQADGSSQCCIVSWCDPWNPSTQGHFDKSNGCVADHTSICDFWYIC